MKVKTNRTRVTRTTNPNAIKYIRIIIASYILAVGMGMISGFDASAYFGNYLSYPSARYAAQVFVVFWALMLLMGYLLRLGALCLTIVILASSIQVNLIAPVQGSLDAFWVDLVVVCGLLASYWPMSHRQLRKQAVVQRVPRGSAGGLRQGERVVPRRVTSPQRTRKQEGQLLSFTRDITFATRPTQKPDPIAARIARLVGESAEDDERVENIFA